MNALKKSVPVFLIYIVLTGGCDILKESDTKGRISVSNDHQKLSDRVEIINQEIELFSIKEGLSKNKTSDRFVHVANVKSPRLEDGRILSATSVDIKAKTVYVSYHLNGEPYAGAVDIIDVQDDQNPEIESTLSFTDTDVNAVEIEENGKKLWLTGGRDVDQSGYKEENHKGAVVGEILIEKNVFKTESYKEVPLPSFSGNAIVEWGQNVYVVSGASQGGFFKLDKGEMEITNSWQSNFAKHIDRRSGDVIALSLANGINVNFDIIDAQKNELKKYETDIPVTPANGKNVIEHFGSVTYAALGSNGVKGFKFDNHEHSLTYEYMVSGNDGANGVTVDGKYVYIANGTDGLYITTHPKNGQKDPDSVFNWYSGTGSVNYVKKKGNILILANGIDGINILCEKM